MLWLLSGGVEDALPAVDLHAHVQLEVDVPLGGRAAEAAAGRRAGPALAEQLTHGREARRLPVRRLAEEKDKKKAFSWKWRETKDSTQLKKLKNSQGPPEALQPLALELVLLLGVLGRGRGQLVAPHVLVLEGMYG